MQKPTKRLVCCERMFSFLAFKQTPSVLFSFVFLRKAGISFSLIPSLFLADTHGSWSGYQPMARFSIGKTESTLPFG